MRRKRSKHGKAICPGCRFWCKSRGVCMLWKQAARD